MIQRAFFDLIGEQQGEERDERVVNVASVPQRSPFRYPGGKTWLITFSSYALEASVSTRLCVVSSFRSLSSS